MQTLRQVLTRVVPFNWHETVLSSSYFLHPHVTEKANDTLIQVSYESAGREVSK